MKTGMRYVAPPQKRDTSSQDAERLMPSSLDTQEGKK